MSTSFGDLPMTLEPVANLRGRAYLAKWRSTFRFERKQRRLNPAEGGRWRTRAGALRPLRRPVFILGCPRSGTTFLGQVLDALPSSSYYFEPPILKYHTRFAFQQPAPTWQTRMVYQLCLRALLLTAPGHGPRIIEKNPNHTWIASTLLSLFPDAQFVIITRDGRDTALSLLRKPWHRRDGLHTRRREPGGYLFGPYPHFYIEPERATHFAETSDVHRCIWIWRRHAEQIDHLRTALPAHTQFHLRYEDLVRQPRETLLPLLQFLGEADDESVRRVLERAADAHDSSVGQWASVFKPEDLATIEAEAGPQLRQLGYA